MAPDQLSPTASGAAAPVRRATIAPPAVAALVRRGLNEILRVPGASVPGVISPAIFLLGLTLVFGRATDLGGFGTASFLAFVLPVALLQSAGFTGAATGVNLGRDIEQGWMDRLLLSPASRGTILAGIICSAGVRVLIPVPALLVIAILVGAPVPSLTGLLVIVGLVPLFAATAATWASVLALRFRTQQAAPLIQASVLSSILFTPSYAPRELLQPWMRELADHNPVTYVVLGLRQVFVGDLTWTTTWHAFGALGALALVFGLLALRSLNRYEG